MLSPDSFYMSHHVSPPSLISNHFALAPDYPLTANSPRHFSPSHLTHVRPALSPHTFACHQRSPIAHIIEKEIHEICSLAKSLRIDYPLSNSTARCVTILNRFGQSGYVSQNTHFNRLSIVSEPGIQQSRQRPNSHSGNIVNEQCQWVS